MNPQFEGPSAAQERAQCKDRKLCPCALAVSPARFEFSVTRRRLIVCGYAFASEFLSALEPMTLEH
jgi:hypothetical protein